MTITGEIFESIKTFGSLVGLATGCFIVWDRFVRHRPIASLAETSSDPDDDAHAVLQIRNVSEDAIRIVAMSWSVEGIVYLFFSKDAANSFLPSEPKMRTQIIGPRTTASWPLMIDPNQMNVADSKKVILTIQWQDLRHPRLPQIPIWRWYSLGDIRAMRGRST